MAPWSNRVAGASFAFEGKTHALRKSSKDGTAIHGDVRSRPWRVLDRNEERFEAALDTRDFEDFNFPFPLELRHTLELRDARLRVDLTIRNAGTSRAPVGFGFHPYFRRRPTERDRDVIVSLPADLVYPAERCIPTGPPVPVSGALDLRGMERLGQRGLDHCFAGLGGRDIRVIYPESGIELRFRIDPIFTHAIVYAPNRPGGEPEEFFAVEPVTNANDGFNLRERGYEGSGVKVLEPGERWGGGWELSVEGV
jgi:aldose 1-epimerase